MGLEGRIRGTNKCGGTYAPREMRWRINKSERLCVHKLVRGEVKEMPIGYCNEQGCYGTIISVTRRLTAIMRGCCNECATVKEVQV